MKLALHLCAHIGRIAPDRYHSSLREAARQWIDWPTLFKELLVQGRIWDCKDLYVAAVAAISAPDDTLFFGTDDEKRSMIDDWVLEEGDESTNLALLDMILEPAQLRSYFPNEAKCRAEAIIAHSPAVMRSRSFIRWILANATDALSGEKKGDDDSWLAIKTHLQGFPGLVWNTRGCFLPGVYVPRNTENPGWVAPKLSPGMAEPIQLALNLAKELNDYNAQVACYKLLIFQSQDPTQLFQELARLQKSVQGDNKGHLETLLSSYLVCKDRPSKERLLEDLGQTDDWGDITTLRDGLTFWARDFIERAVKRSLQGPKSTARLRNPESFYMLRDLSREAQLFTLQNAELDRPPPINVHAPETHIRQRPALPSQNQFQFHGQQSIRPYSRPSSPHRGSFPGPESLPKSLQSTRGDEFYVDRRQREEEEKLEKELDRARKELQAVKENQEREAKDQQDRAMRERLEESERRLREQEEINKKQMEETKKTEMEKERLEQEFKQEKEKQALEAKAQQDRETRERLERAELSLRDQAERLRRAEDRSYQEWLAGRDVRRKANPRGKLVRGRRGTRFIAASSASSESYFSDTSPSYDSDDDTPSKTMRKNRRTSIDSDDESEQEVRIRKRVTSVEGLRREPRRDEVDNQTRDDTRNPQQNSCTDLILYREFQDVRPPGADMSENPLMRLPTSPISLPYEALAGSRRGSTTGPVQHQPKYLSRSDHILNREQEHASEQIPTDPQEQTGHLTAEPQEVQDQVEQPEAAVSRENTEESDDGGSSSFRKAESRDGSQIRSKEQNARIANRPSRPASTSIYVSPRPSVHVHDSTGVWDAWEETRRKKAHRRVIIDPGPSGVRSVSPPPLRSRPSSTQVYDDIQPLGRRASWRDSPVGSPHGDRLRSPTKRRSLIIDADGRPQPVQTTREQRRSYTSDAPGGSHIRIIRTDGGDGGRPIPEISPTAAGSRSRPHSTGGVGTRAHVPDPEGSGPEKPTADSWERVKDGLWKKRKPSTLHEDPEEWGEWGLSKPRNKEKQGESSKTQDSVDPEKGVSRSE